MQNSVTIQFVRKHGVYQKGDIARFPGFMAEKLISEGVAKVFPEPASDALAARSKKKVVTKS